MSETPSDVKKKLSVTLKKNKYAGTGLFATKDIPKDTDLGVTHIHTSLDIENIQRTPLGGFYNHSDNPNCKKKVTVKQIVYHDSLYPHSIHYRKRFDFN